MKESCYDIIIEGKNAIRQCLNVLEGAGEKFSLEVSVFGQFRESLNNCDLNIYDLNGVSYIVGRKILKQLAKNSELVIEMFCTLGADDEFIFAYGQFHDRRCYIHCRSMNVKRYIGKLLREQD